MWPCFCIYFVAMCKSSSLIFVLLFAFIFKLETFSIRLIMVILLIFVGVVLMVATGSWLLLHFHSLRQLILFPWLETQFALLGMILVIVASACGGLRWALTQMLLKGSHGYRMGMDSPASSIFWLAPSMGLTLAVLSLVIEGWYSLFWESGFFSGFGKSMSTLGYVISPGVLAFIMVMSEF